MTGPPRIEPDSIPWGIWGAALVVLAWGLAPFWVMVGHFPWKIDAIKWVTRSATDTPGWFGWVFGSTHFVGYRPVTAFSFTLDHAMGGWTPEVYRLTDFALHGLAALLTMKLFQRLTGSKGLLLLLPVLILAGHPAVEETLPYLPRRSYTLATVFSLAALIVWVGAVRDEGIHWRRVVATTLLTMLGLLSNEVAYVTLPVLPLLAWHQGASLTRSLQASLAPALGALLCVAARFSVLGWAGGYEKHYFAFTRAGHKTLRQVNSFNLPEIVGASFDYVFFPVSFIGEQAPGRRVAILAFIVASFYFWSVVAEPLLHLRERSRRLPLVLGIWLFGYATLFGISRTWFWRQAYPMVVVLALLVGVVAHQTFTHHRGLRRWLRLIPQLLFVVNVLWFSPMFRGMTTSTLWARFEGNQAIRAFDHLLEGTQTPVRAYLVLPLNKASNRNVLTWMNKVRPSPDHEFLLLAYGKRHQKAAVLQGNQLVLQPGASFTKSWARRFKNGRGDLKQLMEPGITTGLLLPDENGAWTWVELQ